MALIWPKNQTIISRTKQNPGTLFSSKIYFDLGFQEEVYAAETEILFLLSFVFTEDIN